LWIESVVRRNILFCYSRLPSFTNTVRDYVAAFGAYSQHRIHYYDMDSGPIKFDLEPFDGVIFNYCFWGRCMAVTPDFRSRVTRFQGLKIAIFQDEYDYFLWHEKTVIDLGIDTIVTCVPEVHWPDVFRSEAFRRIDFINALTGYVPDNLVSLPASKPLVQRAWAIGYRSRQVPFTYGRLTQEKLQIGQRMKAICAERGIAANIEYSEESRIYGDAWPQFIGNCRTVLGTESGSNVFDFDGTLKTAIDAYLKVHPDAQFDAVHELFLKEHDGRICMNQVSPRVFEAIALRTGLVLFEGAYSGIVMPWEHYIPLKKAFSDVDAVLAAVADTDGLAAMIERAHADVIASGKYHFKSFIKTVDAHIARRVPVGKGFEPRYGLIGWQPSPDSALQGLSGQHLQLPTDRPMRNQDQVPDTFLAVRLRWGALHRRIMQRYEALLYSRTGSGVREYLRKNELVYGVLRKCVRLLTGRW